jgi:PmbA protein
MDGLYDETLSSVAEQEKIKRAMDLERLALNADPRVRRVRKAHYGESEYEVWIKNSRGVAGRYRGTSVSCSVSAVAEEGDDSQMGWDFGFSNFFSGIGVETVAANAASKALDLLGARKIPTMRCPVVLDNYVASEILEVLAPSFLADSIQKGKSMLAGRLGKDIFSCVLRIRDDGTLPGGTATAPFDAEGVPQQDTLLVENGCLRAFLYDTYSARKDGTTGTVSRSEMVRSIDRGVLLTGVMGMHTANPISGDFSVGATGIYIDHGGLSFPVKGIAIAGNILDMFSNVVVVGDDIRFYGGVGSPSLKIGALDISGS